jgi:hypothetical protein
MLLLPNDWRKIPIYKRRSQGIFFSLDRKEKVFPWLPAPARETRIGRAAYRAWFHLGCILIEWSTLIGFWSWQAAAVAWLATHRSI